MVPAADAGVRAAARSAHTRLPRPPLLSASVRSDVVTCGRRINASTAPPLDAFAVGSNLHRRELDRRGGATHSANARLGEHRLPEYEARHQRVQLGGAG